MWYCMYTVIYTVSYIFMTRHFIKHQKPLGKVCMYMHYTLYKMTNILLDDVLSIQIEIHLSNKSSGRRVLTQKVLLYPAVSILCTLVCGNVARVQKWNNLMKSYTQTKFKAMTYARSEFYRKEDPHMIGISDCIDNIILKQYRLVSEPSCFFGVDCCYLIKAKADPSAPTLFTPINLYFFIFYSNY